MGVLVLLFHWERLARFAEIIIETNGLVLEFDTLTNKIIYNFIQ